MKSLVPIPSENARDLRQQEETGLGYQVVVSEWCVIAVRGYADEVPFRLDEVATVKVTHERWNFRDWSDKGRHLVKSNAATA